jgi:hypothetical protein
VAHERVFLEAWLGARLGRVAGSGSEMGNGDGRGWWWAPLRASGSAGGW